MTCARMYQVKGLNQRGTRRVDEVSVSVVVDIVAVLLSSTSAAVTGKAPLISWGALPSVVVGVGLVAGVMLLKGYDRRKTIQAMPLNAVLLETDRRGRQLLIARGHVTPVHLVRDDREVLDK